ncbi:MAG: histidinol-phosphate transaminase [Desulfobacterales bacterium]|nr:histidinol-phosphate transaminase [Desulfobacterales bacterium]
MFSERLKQLIPYTAGEQPRDMKYLKLNTNENPYPPSLKIEEFLKSCDIERLRLYPDPLANGLRCALAKRYKVEEENIFVGNGSDEVLSFVFYAFFDDKNGPLLFPQFTYSFYPVYCGFYMIQYEKIPLAQDFSININDYLNKPSCGIILANPNAPTGCYINLEQIKQLIENYQKDRVIVIDEAYIDFGGESAIKLINDYNNLLIIRTFSKGMSLAGIRLGFAIGNKELIDALFTVKDSFNSYPVDMLTQKIGEIAICDEEYYKIINTKIIETRQYFSGELIKAGWEVLPSKANFIFVRKKGLSGKNIYLKLKERGILVRYFDIEGIKDFVRITIGRQEDMEYLLKEMNNSFL